MHFNYIIGICAPIKLEAFNNYLDDEQNYDSKYGLGGDGVNKLIIGLLDSGITVHVFTLDDKVSNKLEFYGKNLKITIIPLRGKIRLLDFYGKESNMLAKEIDMSNIDLIHCHWSYEYALAGIKSKKTYILTMRDNPHRVLELAKGKDKLYRLFRLLVANHVLDKTNFIISNSDYIKNYLEQKGILSTRIYNPFIRYTDEKERLKNEQSKLRLISINNGFSNLKNVKTLIIGFSKVKCYYDIELCLIGKQYGLDGPCHNWCKEQQIYGINFLGELNQKQLEIEIQKSNALIHPSLEESFGNTILEALSNNLICIGGSNSGAVPELLGYGKFGILVDVRSPKAIKNSIEKFINEKFKIEEGELANYLRQFRIDEIVSQHLQYYDSVLNKPNEREITSNFQ